MWKMKFRLGKKNEKKKGFLPFLFTSMTICPWKGRKEVGTTRSYINDVSSFKLLSYN